MHSTQEARREKVLAVVITLVFHALLAWGLSRAMRPEARAPVETTLQVVWVLRPAPGQTPDVRAAIPATTRERRAAPAQPVVQTQAQEPVAAAEHTSRVMSAVYLSQARQRAEAETFAASLPDPLADRHIDLPGAGDGRFRMKPPPAGVAGVVAKVGMLFGAEDADAPCRENRRNIGELAAAGDSLALQQQLDFERRLCRP